MKVDATPADLAFRDELSRWLDQALADRPDAQEWHRRLVAVAWVVALVIISLAGRLAGSQFKDNLNGGTATPSQQAAAFLR